MSSSLRAALLWITTNWVTPSPKRWGPLRPFHLRAEAGRVLMATAGVPDMPPRARVVVLPGCGDVMWR